MLASTAAMDWTAKQEDSEGCEQFDRQSHRLTGNILLTFCTDSRMVLFYVVHTPIKKLCGIEKPGGCLPAAWKQLGNSCKTKVYEMGIFGCVT
eukprot:1157388-Pelagomonas_calceolata.AAC.8